MYHSPCPALSLVAWTCRVKEDWFILSRGHGGRDSDLLVCHQTLKRVHQLRQKNQHLKDKSTYNRKQSDTTYRIQPPQNITNISPSHSYRDTTRHGDTSRRTSAESPSASNASNAARTTGSSCRISFFSFTCNRPRRMTHNSHTHSKRHTQRSRKA